MRPDELWIDAFAQQRPFDQFTLRARVHACAVERVLVRSAEGEPILSVAPLVSPPAYRERRRFGSRLAITFTWRTDPLADRVIPEYYTHPERFVWHVKPANLESGTLVVQAPVDLVGRDRAVDLVVVHDGLHLQLWIDGVLVDEEWPQGPTRNLVLPLALETASTRGAPTAGAPRAIDSVRLLRRGLDPAEVRDLTGEEVARRREREINPHHRGTRQYWRPADYNAYVGDCMPFFHDGVLHLYYLYDRRHHQGKWGAGGHQFAHISTRDLIGWEDHPLALTLERADEGSLGTGNCIFHDGVFHMYWIEHARRIPFREARFHADNIFVACGNDAMRFERRQEPWLRLDYGRSGDVNSFVFRDPGNGKFYHVIGGAGVHDGTITQPVHESFDLQTWTPSDDLSSLGPLSVCPSYMEWRGYHYLFSVCHYYVSDHPPCANRLRLGTNVVERGLIAPMIVRFSDDRALLVGAKGEGGYAGRLVIRELVQLDGGELATRFVEEMMPDRGDRLPLEQFGLRDGELRLDETCPSVRLAGLPESYHLSLTVDPAVGGGPTSWRILVRGEADGRSGYEIRFLPAEETVAFRDSPTAPAHGSQQPLRHGLIERFTGLDRRHSVDVLVVDNLVDVCIDGRYTHLGYTPEGPNAFTIERVGGSLAIHALEASPVTRRLP